MPERFDRAFVTIRALGGDAPRLLANRVASPTGRTFLALPKGRAAAARARLPCGRNAPPLPCAVAKAYDGGAGARSSERQPSPNERMPEILYLLIDRPALIAVPIVFFAASALWSRSRTAWVTAAAWVLYLLYEVGMHAGVLCSGDGCARRTPLYVVYPLLAFLSLVALVQVYVHIRDKRHRERLSTIRR
jgi:hypothetical protein